MYGHSSAFSLIEQPVWSISALISATHWLVTTWKCLTKVLSDDAYSCRDIICRKKGSWEDGSIEVRQKETLPLRMRDWEQMEILILGSK